MMLFFKIGEVQLVLLLGRTQELLVVALREIEPGLANLTLSVQPPGIAVTGHRSPGSLS